MEELLNWMEYIEDIRQSKKVRHKLKDILVIVLFTTLANADDWMEMELFAKEYQDFLRNYIEPKNVIPSHNTINRVMGMISPEVLQQLYGKWQEFLNRNEGEALKNIICIDGKTMRSINSTPQYQNQPLNSPPFSTVDQFPLTHKTKKSRNQNLSSDKSRLPEIPCFLHFLNILFFDF